MAAGELEREDWGRHLRADYRHDGLYPDVPYNILGNAAKDPEGREFDEDAFKDYAYPRAAAVDPTFKARLQARREFHVPQKTDAFDGVAPTLVDAGGNRNMGIVTDAGKHITSFLGSQNVIAFGLCLDPAGSAINVPDRPVIYEPPAPRRVYIDLQQFGFEPTVIRGIWIADCIDGGKNVKSIWMMGDGKMIDPMTEKKVGEWRDDPSNPALITDDLVARLGIKEINKIATDPVSGKMIGYYASVDGASSAGGVFADRYMIGKTMGDTMIVASAMKKFRKYNAEGVLEGEYDNPFYGIGKPEWRNFPGIGRVPAEYYYGAARPQFLSVKTGDRLNAIRAVLKGVPAILERQAKKGTAKFYEYYPGIPAPDQAMRAIIDGYDVLASDAAMRYDMLIAAFAKILRPDGTFPIEQSRFLSDEPPNPRGVPRPARAILSTPDHAQKAGQLILQIAELLTVLRDQVVGHFATRKATVQGAFAPVAAVIETPEGAAVLDRQRREYDADTQNMLGLCPHVGEVVRDIRFPGSPIKRVIPVTRVGTTPFVLATGVPIPNIDIHMFAAISDIAIARPEVPFETLIVDSYYYTRFPALVTLPAAIPVQTPDQAAGGARRYLAILGAWVSAIVGRIRAIIPGVMTGGARAARFLDIGYFKVREDAMPASVLLFETMGRVYAELFGQNLSPRALPDMLLQLVELKYSPRIVDSGILDVVRSELEAARGTILTYRGEIEYKQQEESTLTTLLYNIAIMMINSDIAKEFGGVDDLGFDSIAGEFLARLRAAIAAPPAAAPGGEAALYPEVLTPAKAPALGFFPAAAGAPAPAVAVKRALEDAGPAVKRGRFVPGGEPVYGGRTPRRRSKNGTYRRKRT